MSSISASLVHMIFSFVLNPAYGQQTGPTLQDSSLKIELVTQGLKFPTSMAFINNNGTLLVLEKNTGKVIAVDTDTGIISNSSVIDLRVNSSRERGSLGIAVLKADDNVTSRDNSTKSGTTYVFLYFTESNGTDPVRNVVYRYEWNPQNQTLTNGKLLMTLPALAPGIHNGGKIKIDPRTNYIYTVIGDQNQRGLLQNVADPPSLIQDTSVIFRFTANGSAPTDNPFYNFTSSEDIRKYFAYGIRNSFGLAIDPITGTLWDTENGSDRYDELNMVKPGFNSGWHKIMGPAVRNLTATDNSSQSELSKDLSKNLVNFANSEYADPQFSWKESIAPTDIEFLNSSKLGQSYANNIFVGDFKNGNIYYFKVNENRTGLEFNDSSLSDRVADNEQERNKVLFASGFAGGITDLETGPDGYLYVLTVGGNIYRIVPSSTASTTAEGSSSNFATAASSNTTSNEETGNTNSTNKFALSNLIQTGSPYLGKKDAAVTIIDFSDFQCPKCARHVKNTEPQIKSQYVDTGKVALVFKHFPRLGDDSYTAALASQCVAEQGNDKFWQYHDLLYNNQGPENSGWANKDNLKKFALQISGVDKEKFDQCLDTEKYKQNVDNDLALVKELGFQDTPSFLILKSDGTEPEKIIGPQPFTSFQFVMDNKLNDSS